MRRVLQFVLENCPLAAAGRTAAERGPNVWRRRGAAGAAAAARARPGVQCQGGARREQRAHRRRGGHLGRQPLVVPVVRVFVCGQGWVFMGAHGVHRCQALLRQAGGVSYGPDTCGLTQAKPS